MHRRNSTQSSKLDPSAIAEQVASKVLPRFHGHIKTLKEAQTQELSSEMGRLQLSSKTELSSEIGRQVSSLLSVFSSEVMKKNIELEAQNKVLEAQVRELKKEDHVQEVTRLRLGLWEAALQNGFIDLTEKLRTFLARKQAMLPAHINRVYTGRELSALVEYTSDAEDSSAPAASSATL